MKPKKEITFKFFDYKWKVVPNWAKDTEQMYREWYLERYGYNTLTNLKKFLKDKKYVLEAGCGLGRDSKMFAQLNDKIHIVAMDQSKNALKVAKEHLKEFKNCEILQGDVTNFKYPEKFDFISCDQVIHHTPDPGKTLVHFFDHLNDDGVVTFSVCKKKNSNRDRVDELIFEKASKMTPKQLWKFAITVTEFGKALYDLNIKLGEEVDLQRFVHNNLFRCWYNPDIDFDLCVSSNYDWFSGNPLFDIEDIHCILGYLDRANYQYEILRIYEDYATINVSLRKVK